MTEFRVLPGELSAAAAEYEKLAPLLERASSEVSSIRRNLSFQIRQRQQIEARLSRAAQKLDQEGRALRRTANIGKEVARIYQANEDKLLGMPERKAEKSTPKGLGDYILTWDNLWKLVSKAGFIGKTGSAIAKWVSGDRDLEAQVSLAKDISSLVGKTAKTFGGSSPAKWGKFLLGIEKGAKAKDFWEAALDELGNPGAVKTVGEGVEVGTKWAGTALNYISRGIKNAGKYEGAEYWGRTALEGTVDVAIDVGVSAGLTALVGTAIAIPGVGLAVAVGGAAIVAGGNALCKWVTSTFFGEEKDIAQVVSDGVWELGKGLKSASDSVVKWAGESLNSAGKWLGNTAQKVKAGWKSITNWGRSPAYAGGW